MQQLEGQITLNEFLTRDVPLTWADASRKGDMIPFQRLKDYIGKRVLIEMPRESAVDYRVVMIKNYYENADHSYKLNKKTGKYEMEHTYDKVGYSDDKNKAHKENSWVGEIYCKNGRWKPEGNFSEYAECFYEYKAI